MHTARDPEADDGAERVDELRRRLYRSGATEEDVRRYLAERAEQPAPVEESREQPPAGGAPWVARRALIGAGAALAGAAAIATLVRVDRRAAQVKDPSTPPEALPGNVEDIGEGQVIAVDEGAVSAPVRAATSVRGVAAVGLRYTGRGNAVVPFDPPTGAVEGGRMMVVLTASGTAPVAWRALLIVLRGDGRSYPAVLARGRTREPWGMAGPTTFVYPTSPPTRIAVEASAGTGWTLLVAVTDGIEPALR